MTRSVISDFARKHGMSVEFTAAYLNDKKLERLKNTSPALYHMCIAAGSIVKLLTFGSIRPEISDFTMVLRKTEALSPN
jgi:hypothetical protein